MFTLAVIILVLGAGALATLIGTRLIERAHPPRGRLVEVGGSRQHIVELGSDAGASGPPIVLLHGAGCNLEDMRLALGERLAARHRVILVDRPGLGWSERTGPDAHSPASQAAVLRDLLIKLGVDRAILVGHSWGGTLAAIFALNHPRHAAGLVLIAPPTYSVRRGMMRLYKVLATPIAGWVFARTLALPLGAAAIGPGLRSAFLPQDLPDGYVKRVAAILLLRPKTFLANAHDIAGLKKFLAQQEARYATLAAPTVIITGDLDSVVPVERNAATFAAAVPGAKLRVLPGFGHMPHHGAAEQIIAAVEELASRV